MNCLDSTIPSKSHFFNLHDSSLCRRHVNAASRKSLEIQAYSISKPRTLLKRKFLWKLVFSCSNTSWKSNLGRIDSFSRLNFSDAMWKPAIVRFIILVGKNRSSLLFVQFPVFFFHESPDFSLSGVSITWASRSRQTANVIEFVPRDQNFHLLIVYCWL